MTWPSRRREITTGSGLSNDRIVIHEGGERIPGMNDEGRSCNCNRTLSCAQSFTHEQRETPNKPRLQFPLVSVLSILQHGLQNRPAHFWLRPVNRCGHTMKGG